MRNVQSLYKSGWGMIALLVISSLSIKNVSAQSFSRISSSPIVSEIGGFLGTAWGDYDNDGFDDLLVVNYKGPNLLFHNEGNGSFVKITTGEIATDPGNSYSASWGDYDNDGDPDLFVANYGGGNYLYRNDDGILIRVTDNANPIVYDRALSTSGSWGDYDNDGDLDLFVTNAGSNNFLYQNNGDGTFTKITSGVIVKDKVVSSVVGLWGDYDNDGNLDLYVVNGFFSRSENFLYHNDGTGNFTKITTGRIVNDVEGSTGGSWGDYDNDGYLDLYVTNSVGDAPNSLYRNTGDGKFAKVTVGDIVTDTGHSVGSSWVDYDNDGDLDLFVVNVLGQKKILYQNGGGVFTKMTTGDIVNDAGWSFGCSWADYDRDGDQDVIVTNGGFYDLRNNFFYENNGTNNNWITIQCQGQVSNKSAIGAMVRVKAIISGKPVWQMQQVSGQTGFYGQNSLAAEFGLGNATVIDSLIVTWPSGSMQLITNVVVNQFLEVTELVREHDLRIDAVPHQVSSMLIFSNIAPETRVSNKGVFDEFNVQVTCEIDSAGTIVYSDTKMIDTLRVKQSTNVVFEKWAATEANAYMFKFSVALVGDEQPFNNSVTAQVEAANLLDDFESGVGRWQVSGDWGEQVIFIHAGNYSLEESPYGDYANNAETFIVYSTHFNLSRVQSAHLSYWTRYQIEQDRDFGYVEISTDSGQTWNPLGDAYTGFQETWVEHTRSLAEYCGPDFDDVQLRFRFVSDAQNTFSGWFLDDIALYPDPIETSLDGDAKMLRPEHYILHDNYPNPFNPETTIGYELPQAGSVRVEVYNLLGQRIRTLVDQYQAAGRHKISWDGKNDFGAGVGSGIYLYRLVTDGFTVTKRMVLVR